MLCFWAFESAKMWARQIEEVNPVFTMSKPNQQRGINKMPLRDQPIWTAGLRAFLFSHWLKGASIKPVVSSVTSEGSSLLDGSEHPGPIRPLTHRKENNLVRKLSAAKNEGLELQQKEEDFLK